jgi:hypothetical protein
VAYIIIGETKYGHYVDLWRDPHDSQTAYKFTEVRTEQERDQLIEQLMQQGHVEIDDSDWGHDE